MPEVNFFEIPFDDAERVTNFYSKVFGWEIEKNTSAGFDYYFIHTKVMMVMIRSGHHHIQGA
jgi:predicted enzyme related to lactoylglutathione lyase